MNKFKDVIQQIINEFQNVDNFSKLKSIFINNPGFYRKIQVMDRRNMNKYVDKPENTSDYIDIGENLRIGKNGSRRFYFYTVYQYLDEEHIGEIGFDLYEFDFKSYTQFQLLKKYHQVFQDSHEWESFRYKFIDEQEIRNPKIRSLKSTYKKELGVAI